MGSGYPMIPSAALTAASDMTAVQPTPVAPPNMGGGPQPPMSYYEQLKEIYNDAVKLSHYKGDSRDRRSRRGFVFSKAEIDDYVQDAASRTFQGAHNFRTLDHLVRTIQELDRQGKRPLTENDLSTSEKGAFARTALFGHGVPFVGPFTDEAYGALHALVPGGKGYREARDENRRYLRNARKFATGEGRPFYPDFLANPELMGAVAGTVATMGAAAPTSPGMLGGLARAISPAQAPGVLRSMITGGGAGLAAGVGQLPELTPSAFQENAVPLGANMLFGAVSAGIPPTVGKAVTAWRRPGPLHAEKLLETTGQLHPRGGAGVLADAIAESGTARPMLAEIEGSSFSGLAAEIRRYSREGAAIARRRVRSELAEVAAAKDRFQPYYDALKNTDVDHPALASLMTHDRVKPIVQRLIRDRKIDPTKPINGRALEDIRQYLRDRSNAAFRRRQNMDGQTLLDLKNQAQAIIDEQFTSMPVIREQLAPLIERERRLEQLQFTLSQRPRGANQPLEMKTTMPSEISQDLLREKYQRSHRAYQQLADLLFRPGTAAEHVARINSALPWYNMLGRAAPGVGGLPMMSGNPFFQIQQPQDSIPQEP